MLTILGGAKKNIGDFLIVERSKQVVSRLTGVTDFLEISRWKPIGEQLEAINRSKAIVICGGPAYASNFYPDVLPLVEELEQITVPIVPIGVGLGGMPQGKFEDFQFTESSKKALEFIHSKCVVSGVRDRLTLEALNRSGFQNVTLSGCPVIFDNSSMEQGFQAPREIKKIVFTTPAGRKFFPQTLALGKALRQQFPKAEILASFHRGIGWDEYTPVSEALPMIALATWLRKYRISSVDTAYDLNRIEFYRDCDLHVGYRVHAHVFFASMRKPTFLLQEDTRGVGMSETLGLAETDVYAYESDAVDRVMGHLTRELDQGYPTFQALPNTIAQRFEQMREVLSQIK